MHRTSIAPYAMLDGTLSQLPLPASSQQQSYPAACRDTATTELQCDELMQRTAIQCDAITDFQRIVGMHVAMRYGTWAFSQQMQEVRQYCPRCGCSEPQQQQAFTASGNAHDLLPSRRHHRPPQCFVTPWCTESEVQQHHGCVYTTDAEELLQRRYLFDRELGETLRRIREASHRIQDTVMQ